MNKTKPILGEPVKKPAKAHAKNLETLNQAFKNDDVALLEYQLKATGEKVAVLVAVQPEEDGDISLVPFAVMLNGNPYEMLNPPDPDGGFRS